MLPAIEQTLVQLLEVKRFSELVGTSGFWRIPLPKESNLD